MDHGDVRITTERLILRPPRPVDFDGWAAFMADEESMRFLGGPVPRPTAYRGFLSMAGAWSMQGFGMFSVLERDTGRWVGRLGPWRPEGWPGNEVGWGIAREAWGRGYATEGSVAAMNWAFDVLGWPDVIHCIDFGNTASERVAEHLGSRVLRTGVMPPPFDDHEVQIWGQTREEWGARA